MQRLLLTLLQQLPAEIAHDFALKLLRGAAWSGVLAQYQKHDPISVMGLTFPNRIGLAAGFDKNGVALKALQTLGFGFIELGTVTPKAQIGSPKPRLFRLSEDRAIINRMGFNNAGVEALIERIQSVPRRSIVGINIGKNASTSLAEAIEDYRFCFHHVYAHADYVTLNISSPNTRDLRELQKGQSLVDLLASLKQQQTELKKLHQRYVPLVVKIAPDLTQEEIGTIAETLQQVQMDGVIATNTTITRPATLKSNNANEQGGLSGAPLKTISNQTLKTLAQALQGSIPIIAVGGVMSLADAHEKLNLGASLVQVYSGLVYRGLDLLRELLGDE